MTYLLLDRITIQPGLMGGKPTIRSLRFLVSDILEFLSSGLTESEILEQHHVLEKADIAAALLYASMKIKNTVVIHAVLQKFQTIYLIDTYFVTISINS